MRGGKPAICTALITLLAFSTIILNYQPSTTRAQTTTTLYIDPELTVADMGATFSVNISVYEVTDLCSWQAYIYFKNEILEAIEYAEGPFLKSHGSTMFDGSFDNNYNATHGELWMYCLRSWTGYGVDGSGTLATVTFKAKLSGTSPLNLANTILGNSTAQRISHTTIDGNIQVTGIRNIAVTNVNPLKTVVGQGYSMHINVTVENQGDQTETFNGTTYANTTVIQTETITLESGASTTIAFIWNTAGFAKGNYTIWAYAWPVPGETNTADNSFTDCWVKVVTPGNVNGDQIVDMKDITIILRAYGSTPGQPKYNPNADVNCDGIVDMKDVTIALRNYGKIDP